MIKQIDADIYSINETHLNQNDCIEVELYKWIGFNRCSIHKDTPKASGGVGILIGVNNILLNSNNTGI